MNLGTFVRSSAIDTLVEDWLVLAENEGTKCQIVSLGAGSDTRFWRLAVRFQSVTPAIASETILIAN